MNDRQSKGADKWQIKCHWLLCVQTRMLWSSNASNIISSICLIAINEVTLSSSCSSYLATCLLLMVSLSMKMFPRVQAVNISWKASALIPIESTNESKLVITGNKLCQHYNLSKQIQVFFFLNHCLHEILRPLSTLLHSHWCTGGSFDWLHLQLPA